MIFTKYPLSSHSSDIEFMSPVSNSCLLFQPSNISNSPSNGRLASTGTAILHAFDVLFTLISECVAVVNKNNMVTLESHFASNCVLSAQGQDQNPTSVYGMSRSTPRHWSTKCVWDEEVYPGALVQQVCMGWGGLPWGPGPTSVYGMSRSTLGPWSNKCVWDE